MPPPRTRCIYALSNLNGSPATASARGLHADRVADRHRYHRGSGGAAPLSPDPGQEPCSDDRLSQQPETASTGLADVLRRDRGSGAVQLKGNQLEPVPNELGLGCDELRNRAAVAWDLEPRRQHQHRAASRSETQSAWAIYQILSCLQVPGGQIVDHAGRPALSARAQLFHEP